MTDFTPLASLFGGGLIGLSATLLMLGLGRVAGATGILTGIILPTSWNESSWRLAFLAGAVLAVLLLIRTTGLSVNVLPPIGLWQVTLGGLIVGIGVSLANGCTSGHGICGLARFSPRSLVAVLTFMATAGLTVYVIRHVLGA